MLPSQDQTVTCAFVLGTCVYALPSVSILPYPFCFSHLKNLKIAEDPGSSQSQKYFFLFPTSLTLFNYSYFSPLHSLNV